MSSQRRKENEVVGSAAFHRFEKAKPLWELLERGRLTLDEMMRRWRLPPEGEAELLNALSGDPVRRVQATPRSVSLRVPSAKTNRLVQCESRTVEYALVQYCEYSSKVLLYVDQPMTVEIGKGRPYVCDYLVVLEDGVCAYECKALDWLERQATKRNPRYVYDDAQGRWRSPVAEEAFARYGFGYRVFHSGDVDVRWLRNVRYIADFLAIDSPPGVDQALARIRAVRSLPFGEAIWVLGTSRETWLWLIASAGVAVDFGTEQLDRPDLLALAWLHDSQATLECHRLAVGSSEERGVVRQLAYGSVVSMDPGSRVLLRGEPHTVVSRDADQVILRPGGYDEDPALGAVTLAVESVEALLASGDLQAVAPRPRDVVAACARVRLATVTDEERARAMRRWEAIGSYRETGKVPAGVPRRTLFRWLAWARVASAVHGSEFLGMFRRLEGTTGVNRNLTGAACAARGGRGGVPCGSVCDRA